MPVSVSKTVSDRGSNSSSSHQLCKKITVSKHFTQQTLYSPDASFKNMTICANELPCSSSCQRVKCHHVSSHSFYVNPSRHVSLEPTVSKYHPCDYSSYAIMPSHTVQQQWINIKVCIRMMAYSVFNEPNKPQISTQEESRKCSGL